MATSRYASLGGIAVATFGIALTACLPSCDCRRAGPVPFGLDGATPGPATGTAGSGSATPGDEPGTATTPTELEAPVAFDEGTTAVAIEGAPLSVEDGSIRALLATDVDGDADRDALMLVRGASGLVLRLARRDGATFGRPRLLARL
ncbi:MAG: hypothetical protein NZ898_08415, partial [Myxococcota bacterium]|nr:hypothetical protein [Myxococcota bacterium]